MIVVAMIGILLMWLPHIKYLRPGVMLILTTALTCIVLPQHRKKLKLREVTWQDHVVISGKAGFEP